MNKYKVRLELNVNSADLGWVTVEADSPEQAKQVAVDAYTNGTTGDINWWASDYIESELDISTIKDWEVEKGTTW
jgi:hypothetical protein